MCGIFGLISTKIRAGFSVSEMKSLHDLMVMNSLRGEDATGYSLFNNKNEFYSGKHTIPGWDMVKTSEWDFINTEGVRAGLAFIGHNRKKTIGDNKVENAHPFIVDNRYIFFHNGTLTNWKDLTKNLLNKESIEVDSEALAGVVTPCNGDITALSEVFYNVYGAYACVWFDTLDLKLYVVRNSDRSLWFTKTSFGYAFASELGMLSSALGRNNIKITDPQEFKPKHLYTLDISTIGSEFIEEKIPEKKAGPPIGGATLHHMKNMDVDNDYKEVSKNRYKSIRKKYVGSTLSFWINDFEELEPEADQKTCMDWLILGESDNVKMNHTIKGILHGISMDDLLYKWDGALLKGIVSNLDYNKAEKRVEFTVTAIHKTASSVLRVSSNLH